MINLCTAICCLLCSFVLAKRDDECEERRCCVKRDEVLDLPILHDPCETLSDEECGENDDFCIWNCHPDEHPSDSRRFRGISDMEGQYEEPVPGFERGKNETFEECMASGRTIDRDDCGVEYEDIIDEDLLRQFCLDRHNNSKFSPDIDGGDNPDRDAGKRDVLGNDGRVLVPSGYRYYWPYRVVLYIIFANGNGGYSRCTASLISPYWAITAGHCVYGGGDWYSDWRLYKYVHSCSDANSGNQYTVWYAVTFTAFISASSTNDRMSWDMGWLRLHQDAGDQLGYFGFGYNTGFSGTVNFNIISYPADKSDCSKWWQSCSYSEWDGDHQQITYECDTYGGASGSPVYKYVWGYGNVVYAIHTYGACYDANGNFQYNNVCNMATRITQSKYNAICYWLEKDTPNRCP